MRKIHSKHIFVKRGNMTMVMIISIVVVLTMLSLCVFLAAVSKNQLYANGSTNAYANIDASTQAVADVVEQYLKTNIAEDVENPETEETFDVDSFLNQHKTKIEDIVQVVLVEKYDDIVVSFEESVPYTVYDEDTMTFDCIVVSIDFENEHTYKLSFYIKNTAGFTNEGSYYQKGDYITTWIV